MLDSQGRGKTSNLLTALDWVLSNRTAYNIRVVNLSLGTAAFDSDRDDPTCKAVRKLVDAGVVVVAAAGNNGKNSANAQERRARKRLTQPSGCVLKVNSFTPAALVRVAVVPGAGRMNRPLDSSPESNLESSADMDNSFATSILLIAESNARHERATICCGTCCWPSNERSSCLA